VPMLTSGKITNEVGGNIEAMSLGRMLNLAYNMLCAGTRLEDIERPLFTSGGKSKPSS
jgi:hypothetical protein